jgi:competence protein ComEA
VLLGSAVAVLVSILSPHGTVETVADAAVSPSPVAAEATDPTTAGLPDAGPTAAPVMVHILGAVARPGLYQLVAGARAIDAVAAAGGLTADADEAQLNLARFVSDGEQIYVPKLGEAAPAPVTGTAASPGAPAAPVNINTADSAALESLPGVGPALAQRIIAFRDANGPFATVDDLLDVSGIGDKTLDGFRDGITV